MCLGPTNGNQKLLVIVVDPHSTGYNLVQEIQKRGFPVIAIWSQTYQRYLDKKKKRNVNYHAELYEPKGNSRNLLVREIENVLRGEYKVKACISGSEFGLYLCDELCRELGLVRSITANGLNSTMLLSRQVQQDAMKCAGLSSIRETSGKTFDEVRAFCKSYPVVVKGTGAVTVSLSASTTVLCHDEAEVRKQFELNKRSGEPLLCQEYVRGEQFIVENVSCRNTHKTTMIWTYDKRSVNGANNVCFGLLPVDPQTKEASTITAFVKEVLRAFKVENGASTAHVIVRRDNSRPCLLELSLSLRGGNGHWIPLAKTVTGGYTQVDATVDAYLDREEFMAFPEVYPRLKAYGQEVILISHSRGKVRSMPGLEVMKHLPSFVSLSTNVHIGSEVDYTTDLLTNLGSVILAHSKSNVYEKDLEFIRYMEEMNSLVEYETKLENLKRPRSDLLAVPMISDDDLASEDEDSESVKEEQLHRRRVFSADGPHLTRYFSNDRPELGRALMKRMTTVDASREAVIVVDPYSTGACVALEIGKRGFNVIALWSKEIDEEMRSHVPQSCVNLRFYASVDEQPNLTITAMAVQRAAGMYKIVACICGGEVGVPLCDALSEKLGLRTNGTGIPRRDKKVQQELIKKAGLRSVRQACSNKFEEVEEFLKTEEYPLVVKPVESAGSDGVKLCHDFNEAKQHFLLLMSAQKKVGGSNAAVLCQEFLRGKEYVVDHVSRDGLHKTMMLWTYDKRPANGAVFVYFGCIPLDSQCEEAQIMVPYIRKVLDALGVKNGASHSELIITHDGPCLVEVNCRAHGGDGNWAPMVRELVGGYCQVDALVDSYLDSHQFYTLPNMYPSPFKAFGQEVLLVSYSRGIVKEMPAFEVIKKLPSFIFLETGIHIGSKVDFSTDLFTCVGSVILVHHDKEVVRRDIEKCRQMEIDNTLFVYEKPMEKLSGFSSVWNLLLGRGLENQKNQIMVYSERPDLVY